MKYSKFLALFLLPIVVVSGLIALPRITRRELLVVIVLPIIAVVWTTPWDNYLVAKGVWRYDPNKVWNVILGYVPLEEYLFFVLQTLTMTFPMLLLLRAVRESDHQRDAAK